MPGICGVLRGRRQLGERFEGGGRGGGHRRGRVRRIDTTDTGAPAKSARFRVGGGTRRNRRLLCMHLMHLLLRLLRLRLLLLLLRGEIESLRHTGVTGVSRAALSLLQDLPPRIVLVVVALAAVWTDSPVRLLAPGPTVAAV